MPRIWFSNLRARSDLSGISDASFTVTKRSQPSCKESRHRDAETGTFARQSTLSSFCAFLVKRGHLETNPVARLDRPPHRREAPRQVPGSAIMDALVKAAQQRQRPRDLAIFLILRYSGMRRESVATLRVRNRWTAGGVSVTCR
jgi:site-specific recombinase XerC